MPYLTYRGDNSGRLRLLGDKEQGVPNSLIRVVYEAGIGFPSPERHLQGLCH